MSCPDPDSGVSPHQVLLDVWSAGRPSHDRGKEIVRFPPRRPRPRVNRSPRPCSSAHINAAPTSRNRVLNTIVDVTTAGVSDLAHEKLRLIEHADDRDDGKLSSLLRHIRSVEQLRGKVGLEQARRTPHDRVTAGASLPSFRTSRSFSDSCHPVGSSGQLVPRRVTTTNSRAAAGAAGPGG